MADGPAFAPGSGSRFAAALLLIPLLLAAACSDTPASPPRSGTPTSAVPRPFLMGISSVPHAPTEAAYRETFDLAAAAGEVVLIQRAPPWSEFVPGGTISDRTERLTRLERDLARQRGLRIVYAIDPTDPRDRGQLAALPDDLRGRDFADGRVRAAFIAYAKYVARNYRPAYIALGVEVDMFFNRRGDGAFRNFQSLYFETYDAVKEVSPSTLVFPTFQFEDLGGKLRSGQTSALPLSTWHLIGRFEQKMDMLAVSSFPGLVFARASLVPTGYYDDLKGRSERPLAFLGVGWGSATPPDATDIVGAAEQSSYARQVLIEAEGLGAALVVWYLGRDPEVPPAPEFGPLQSMGLRDAQGDAKDAWRVWLLWVGRRIDQP
jgi:hypothetical protein